MTPISMNPRTWMVAHPRRLAIESNRFDLRVHGETTRALPDRPLLEHGEDLLEHSCHFRLNHVRRCECADLQPRLAVVVVSIVLRNLSTSRTCHRVRTLLIFAFDAANFSRRSPDFHSSLRPGSFFLPRFGLIEFSHSSRSRMILCHRQTQPRTGSKTTSTLRALSGRYRVCADPIVPCCRCRVTRGG
jgi:hypothetical protein